MEVTHSELVKYAAKWLKSRCSIIITEMVTYGEEADAIGFGTNSSMLIECKVSISDFFSDKKKPFRQNPSLGIGTYRYYLCPNRLIEPCQIPNNWGLLWLKGSKIYKKVSAQPQDKHHGNEQRLLLSAMRRIPAMIKADKNASCGVDVKFYSFTTGSKSTLGIMHSNQEEYRHDG